MAFERPEHGFGAEPDWGSEGRKVQCQMKGRSKVGILEMVMKMVRWFHLAFLLLKQVKLWWRG